MINSETFFRFGLFFCLEILTIWAFYEIPIHYIYDTKFKDGSRPSKPFKIEIIFSILKWFIFSCLFGAFAFFVCFSLLEDNNKISKALFNDWVYGCMIIAFMSSLLGIYEGYKRINEYLDY